MRVIDPCDTPYRSSKGDVCVFLAGGITSCPDWQPLIVDMIRQRFADPDDLVVFNPRRQHFDVNQVGIAEEQIRWEHQYLRKSHIVWFWFPHETLCPITLFEYGVWLTSHLHTKSPRLVVGCHPDYKRKLDLEVQTKLVAPYIMVRNTWNDMMFDLLEQYSHIRNVIASS